MAKQLNDIQSMFANQVELKEQLMQQRVEIGAMHKKIDSIISKGKQTNW